MRAKLWVLAAVMGGLALPAQAHELTMSECLEGSDFIKNAALSRDYGMARDDFLGRMQSDLAAIQAATSEAGAISQRHAELIDRLEARLASN